MFTKDQIIQAHSKVKSGADFPRFIQDLLNLGAISYENFVGNGETHYFGEDGFTLEFESKYPPIAVNPIGSAAALKQALLIHQQGQTDYPTFCRQAAAAGVEKWKTDMIALTVTYFDKEGGSLVVEAIPLPD